MPGFGSETNVVEFWAYNVYNMPMSPVVFYFESLKFKINANDHNPPHVHIEGRGAKIRINLLTLQFMDAKTGFSNRTLELILEEVTRRQNELTEEWRKYHEKD